MNNIQMCEGNQQHLNVNKNNQSVKTKAIGAVQVAGGAVAAYKGIEHGLPRALGIRTEYHVTPKVNAKLIEKANYILDPIFGGKNGMGDIAELTGIAKQKFKQNSKGFIHITGVNSSTGSRMGFDKPTGLLQTINRKEQVARYKHYAKGSKKFCIPGIDSYFDKNFIPDSDDFALKTANKVKCYKNRFSAMVGGLKKFGLKGIKENKNRVVLGIVMIAAGITAAVFLIKKGIEKFKSQ